MKNNLMPRKSINIDKPNNIPIASFKQEDDGILKLALYCGATSIDLTDQTFRLGIKRRDGSLVELTEGFAVSNQNELDITLKNSIFAIPGVAECDLEIIDAEGRMTTASFFITVSKKVLGENNLIASNEIASVDKVVIDLKNKAAEMESEVSQTINNANEVIVDFENRGNSSINTIKEDYSVIKQEVQEDLATMEVAKAAEVNRVTEENARKEQEKSRVQYETNRATKEEIRINNEEIRLNNESIRERNEQYRINQENTRNNQEDNRVMAEGGRVEEFNFIMDEYDTLKKVVIDDNNAANLQNQINWIMNGADVDGGVFGDSEFDKIYDGGEF